ncbi:hypothetical protein L7F22_017892, partial [Adiantum nelumboides]|nr:hypothetical protein [Adiantum nelumboides]
MEISPMKRYRRLTGRRALEDAVALLRREMEAEIQKAAAAMASQLEDLRKENQGLHANLCRTKEELELLRSYVRELREEGEIPQLPQ